MRQEKRHKLQIFYEILRAIEEDSLQNQVALPTHVQHFTRMSYDKMMNHLSELEGRGLIHRVSGLVAITDKGKKFVEQYDQLMRLIESAGL